MNYILLLLPSQQCIPLQKDIITMGRDKKNDIIIKNPFVSKNHCQLIKKNNGYYIKDLNTKNGTYINAERISVEKKLVVNDIITFSSNRPIFQYKNKQPEINQKNKKSKIKLLTKLLKHPLFYLAAIPLVLTLLMVTSFFINSRAQNTTSDLPKKRTVSQEYEHLMEKHGEKYLKNSEIINKIEKYIIYYQKSSDYQTGINNKEKYSPMINRIFSQYGIPLDLTYLAFAESNYESRAYNRYSGARGMWQLMRETAKEEGLIINKKTDQRLDPEKSTEAAAKYINDLISIFGIHSFTLVIASYNAGDGTIRAALREIKDPINDRNFWYLYENNLLPEETKEYVLKVLALIIMTENPNVILENHSNS